MPVGTVKGAVYSLLLFSVVDSVHTLPFTRILPFVALDPATANTTASPGRSVVGSTCALFLYTRMRVHCRTTGVGVTVGPGGGVVGCGVGCGVPPGGGVGGVVVVVPQVELTISKLPQPRLSRDPPLHT